MSIDRDFLVYNLLRGGHAPDLTMGPPGLVRYRLVKPLEVEIKSTDTGPILWSKWRHSGMTA